MSIDDPLLIKMLMIFRAISSLMGVRMRKTTIVSITPYSSLSVVDAIFHIWC